MTLRDTLWAVTSGEYSDYTVWAVFESKGDAEAVAKVAADTDQYAYGVNVEAMAFCKTGDNPTEMVTVYSVTQELWDDGSVSEPHETSETTLWCNTMWDVGKRPTVRFVRAPVHQNRGGRLEVRGTNHNAVLKAATERRAMIRAHLDQTGKVGPVINVAVDEQ